MNKKNNKSSKKIVYLVLILILGISVGYAALSATLKINGSSTIRSAKWSVHFGETANDITVTQGSVSGANVTKQAALKTGSNTEIEFSVNLSEPGDFYEFTANVVNDGTIDATIGEGNDSVKLNVVAHELEEQDGVIVEGEEIPENSEGGKLGWSNYFSYSVVWDDITPKRLPAVSDTLEAPSSVSNPTVRPVRVRVYFDKEKINTNDDLPKKDIKLDLTFSMNFVQNN